MKWDGPSSTMATFSWRPKRPSTPSSLSGVDEKTSAWWNSLEDGQRLLAETEARRYESLSDKERDSIWEEADSIEAEAESDEIDLPTK